MASAVPEHPDEWHKAYSPGAAPPASQLQHHLVGQSLVAGDNSPTKSSRCIQGMLR